MSTQLVGFQYHTTAVGNQSSSNFDRLPESFGRIDYLRELRKRRGQHIPLENARRFPNATRPADQRKLP
jgi:hypothetical protein